MVRRRGRRRGRRGRAVVPLPVAAEHDDLRHESLGGLDRLREPGLLGRALDVDVEAVRPRRRALGAGLQRGQIHAARRERLEGRGEHAGFVRQPHEQGCLPAHGRGAGVRRNGLTGERQKPRLVGRIIFDALGERLEAVRPPGSERRDGGLIAPALPRHDLRAAGGVPFADELGVRQVCVQPDPALAEGHRMREDAADLGKRRAGNREERVEHRQEDLVREMQGPVAERLVQEVVRRRHGAEERVLDREAARVGAVLPHRRHDIAHLAARHDRRLRPAPLRGRFGEGPVRPLDGNPHVEPPEKQKAPPFPAGPGIPNSVARRLFASARSPNRTRQRPRRSR